MQQGSYHFYFRGCGWKAKDMTWGSSEITWIRIMDQLMSMMFGGDFLQYHFDKKKICHVLDRPTFCYNRDEWLEEYDQMILSENTSVCKDQQGSFFHCVDVYH